MQMGGQGKLNPSSVVSNIIENEADNKFSVCFLLATLFDQACSFISLIVSLIFLSCDAHSVLECCNTFLFFYLVHTNVKN